jgi:hypothetical protein
VIYGVGFADTSGNTIVCIENSALGFVVLSNDKTNEVGFKKFVLMSLFI